MTWSIFTATLYTYRMKLCGSVTRKVGQLSPCLDRRLTFYRLNTVHIVRTLHLQSVKRFLQTWPSHINNADMAEEQIAKFLIIAYPDVHI